jgi:hypothetical protein
MKSESQKSKELLALKGWFKDNYILDLDKYDIYSKYDPELTLEENKRLIAEDMKLILSPDDVLIQSRVEYRNVKDDMDTYIQHQTPEFKHSYQAETPFLGKIYRLKGQICFFQERLGLVHKMPILHDYIMTKDSDGVMMLRCRSCGFINFAWKEIFKGNYGYFNSHD